MIKLLWIDDSIYYDLSEKVLMLHMEDDIDANFARNATEGYHRMGNESFDVIIFDLLLPPGPDDMWNHSREAGEWKYGTVLLKLVCGDANGRFKHLKDTKLGVLSTSHPEENQEIFAPPISLHKKHYAVKTSKFLNEDFLYFIRDIYHS